MRKTNSKETRRAVEAYVLDEVDGTLERCDVVNPLRPVDEAFRILRNEMEYQHTIKDDCDVVGRGIANMYRKSGRMYTKYIPATNPYWVWYLAASAGCFELYYDAMRDRLAEWLDETPEEAARYSNDKVAELYRYLTASAFERLHTKENEPHTVKVSDFIRLYDEHNGGCFFSRETLKYWGQTRKSFDVEAFYLVTDYAGRVHDCYKVYSRTNLNGYKETYIHYFDRVTLDEIHGMEV